MANTSTPQNSSSAVAFKVNIDGNEIEPVLVVSWTVEQDIGQPDMCSITLRNDAHEMSDQYQPGSTIVISAGDSDTKVFNGEVSGMQSEYRSNGQNVLTVRGFNKLHGLTRGRKSKTYVQMTDARIASDVAGRNSLQASCGELADKITHDHIYQRNQTDLEFLRQRASRLGYDIWVDSEDGTTLHFNTPNASEDSGILLRYGDAVTAQENDEVFLKRFSPKLSSGGLLEEMEVRGWDPKKKEEIIGSATIAGKTSPLGSSPMKMMSAPGGDGGGPAKSFQVDHPIYSIEEANKLAEAKLARANLGYMTGDGECRGTPNIKPGVVITVTVNPDKPSDRFNGKYIVTGAVHKFSSRHRGSDGGYVTMFRVCRDAEGG